MELEVGFGELDEETGFTELLELGVGGTGELELLEETGEKGELEEPELEIEELEAPEELWIEELEAPEL